MPDLGPPDGFTVQVEIGHCFYGGVWAFKRFGENLQSKPRQSACVEKPLELETSARQASLVVQGLRGISITERTVVVRLMESTIEHPPVLGQRGGRRAQERNNGACHPISPQRVTPIIALFILTLKLVDLVCPHMSLVQMPLCWTSEFVHPCPGPLKTGVKAFCSDLSYSSAITNGFHSQMLQGLLFPALISQAEEPFVELKSLTLQEGSPQLKYVS